MTLKLFDGDLVTCLANLLLCPLKIYENPFYCFIYSVIYLSFSTFGILGNFIGFCNTNDTVNKLEALVCFSAQLNGTMLFLQVLKSRKKVFRLFSKLEKKQLNIDTIPDRTTVFIHIKLIWFSVALGVSTIIITTPSFFLYFVDDTISDKRSLMLPFWYSCGDGDSTEDGYFCWKTSTKNEMLVKNATLFVITTTQVFAYISTFTLFGIAVGELGMHLENIGKRVDHFVEDADKVEIMIEEENLETDSQIVVRNEETFYQQFIQIIKYQQFLYGCIALAVDTWKTYVSYYYASAFIDVTLLLFVADMERRNEKLLAFRALTMCQLRLLIGFIVAHCSQNISHLIEDFSNQLAKIRWYERNMKFNKIYLQILSFHQKTNVMKIYGIVELNFSFYARMMKNIYSFVNLMLLRTTECLKKLPTCDCMNKARIFTKCTTQFQFLIKEEFKMLAGRII